jgi:hypothetical protein
MYLQYGVLYVILTRPKLAVWSKPTYTASGRIWSKPDYAASGCIWSKPAYAAFECVWSKLANSNGKTSIVY